MIIDSVLGRRRLRRTADIERHTRKCGICKHSCRDAIEQDYLRQRSPRMIVREYGLKHHSAVYRHVNATGIAAQRRANLSSALEVLLEQVESAPVTLFKIVRAAEAYARIPADDSAIPPPTRIFRRRSSKANHPPLANSPQAVGRCAPRPKNLIANLENRNATTH